MMWRGHFYARYYGTKKVTYWDKPDHVMDPCEPPDVFFGKLYRGKGGYEKTVDADNGEGDRLVIFESESGEWHLFSVKEECERGT
jgi:hypothetical protein